MNEHDTKRYEIEVTHPDDSLDSPPAYIVALTAEHAANYVRSALESGASHIEINSTNG